MPHMPHIPNIPPRPHAFPPGGWYQILHIPQLPRFAHLWAHPSCGLVRFMILYVLDNSLDSLDLACLVTLASSADFDSLTYLGKVSDHHRWSEVCLCLWMCVENPMKTSKSTESFEIDWVSWYNRQSLLKGWFWSNRNKRIICSICMYLWFVCWLRSEGVSGSRGWERVSKKKKKKLTNL